MKLEYKILQHTEDKHTEAYFKAYQLYKKMWSSTFKEIKPDSYQWFSDDFLVQSRIHCLFVEGECGALICTRFIDLDNPAVADMNYMSYWEPKDMELFLSKNWIKISILGGLVAEPTYRKAHFPVHLARHVGELASLDFFHNDSLDLQIITVRNSRSVDKLSFFWGGETYRENILFRGEKSNQVLTKKEIVWETAKAYPDWLRQLYYHKTVTYKGEGYERIA